MSQQQVRRVVAGRSLVAVAVLAATPAARATDLTWSAASPTGAGQWDLTTTDWSTGVGGRAISWIQGDGALFASGASTVSVTAAIQATQLTFNAAGFTIQGGGGTLTLGTPTAPGLIYDGGTIALPIHADAGMTFRPTTRGLFLTAASTYTGPTTIDGTNAIHLQTPNALPSASDITWTSAATTTLDVATNNQSFHSLAISTGGSLISTGGNVTVAGAIVDDGNLTITGQTFNGSYIPGKGILKTPSFTGSGSLNLSDLAYLTVGADNSIDTFTGNINPGAGATDGGIMKVGSGEWILLGNTRLTGFQGGPSFDVEGGTLAGNTNSIVGRVHLNMGASLLFAIPADGTFAGNLDGGGDVRLNGQTPATPRVLTFTQANHNTGNVTLGSAGILSVSNDNQLGTLVGGGPNPTTSYATLTFDGGTLRTSAAIASARPIVATAQGGTLDTAGQASTFTGPVTTTPDGAGFLTITGGGNATFSGSTVALHSILVSGGNVAFSNAAAVTLTGVFVPAVKGQVGPVNPFSISANTGTFTVDSGSRIAAGDVLIGAAPGGNASAVVSNARLAINGSLTVGLNGTAPGTGAVTCTSVGGQLTVSDRLILQNNSSLTVAGGTTTLGALDGGAATTVTIAASTRAVPVDFEIGSSGGDGVYAGTIAGPGALTKTGVNTQTLSGANTYTGASFISGGSLVLSGSSTSSSTSVGVGATFVANGSLTGSVNVTKLGTLTGTGRVGTTVINSGGTLDPGSAATTGYLLIDGDLTLASGATTTIDLAPKGWDLIAVNGHATLGGALAFQTGPGGPPAIGSILQLVIQPFGSTATGDFGLVTGFDLGHGLSVARVTPSVFIVTLAGDANTDARVDFTDLLALARHYGQTAGAGWREGDFNYSGTVDFADLLILAKEYGQSDQAVGGQGTLANAGGSAFVGDWALAQSLAPEPASVAALAGLAGFAIGRRRAR